jgi:nucleoside-diphosphate-sugar epimerase
MIMSMKILLTGAAGFTGLIFKKQAEEAGHTVISLKADLTDRAAVIGEVVNVQPTAVVHLAAISFVGHADEVAFYEVNVIGTLNLLTALAGLPVKPKKVLLASSANVYGNCVNSPISEQQPPAPVNHYAMSKLAMEYLALTFADRLPIIIARPFNYTGLGHDSRFVVPKIVEHFKNGATEIELGNLNVLREYNDVRMVCKAYLGLLSLGIPSEIYNIASGRAISIQTIISSLEGLTGHKINVRVNPAFVRANEIAILSGSPKKIEDLLGPLSHPSLEETLSWMLETKNSE